MNAQNYKDQKQADRLRVLLGPAAGFKTTVPPFLRRALESLTPEARERAVTRYRAAALDEAARRDHLRAQARLLAAGARERERDAGVTAARDEAYRLLSADAPLGGYASLLRARARAERAGAEPPSRDAYAEALLARQGRLEALSGHARELAVTLVTLALEVGLGRAYHPRTTEVAFHLPQSVLATALWPDAAPETGRKRVQRALKALTGLGLLSYRGRVGNARDRATGKPLGWKDGTVILVRLAPGQARPLSHEDLAYPWRDLEADIKRGRTARAVSDKMSQSNTIRERFGAVEILKDWALAPVVKQDPVIDRDIPGHNLRARARNAIMDVRLAPRELRRDLVESAARLLAHALADPGSLPFYAALLWGALRRYDRGEDRFQALAQEVERVLVDREEGFARKAGALLVSRLRKSGLYALVETPPWRVA